MSSRALKTLWWILALFALSFSTAAFLRTRGLKPANDPFGILDRDPSGVPALALPLEIILFGALLWLTREWSEAAVPTAIWTQRIPLPYFDAADVDLMHRGGRVVQTANLILFVITPFLLLLAMGIQYWMATIYFSVKRGPTVSLGLSEWSHFNTPAIYAAAHGREGFFVLGNEKGPQYYPLLTWVYAVAVFGLGVYLGIALWRIFDSPRAGSNDPQRALAE